jgi:hypothetical protein
MNRHCTAGATKACKCPTCGLVQEGKPKPCSIPDCYDVDSRLSWGDLYEKFLCVGLAIVAVYGVGKAMGKW